MRAPGHPQAMFAIELMMDHMAETIGMDPLEFRLLNETSDVRREMLKVGAELIGWSRIASRAAQWPGPIKRGLGIGVGDWGKFPGQRDDPRQRLPQRHDRSRQRCAGHRDRLPHDDRRRGAHAPRPAARAAGRQGRPRRLPARPGQRRLGYQPVHGAEGVSWPPSMARDAIRKLVADRVGARRRRRA